MQVISPFPECTLGITTKADGGIVSLAQFQDLLLVAGITPRALVIPRHAHATQITPIALPLDQTAKELVCDGLMTSEKNVVLAHRVADCCPIIMLDRRKRALATLHGGWKGLTLGIVGMGILTLKAGNNSRNEDLWVWIGPCIQKDSYICNSLPVQFQLEPWKTHIHVREDGYHIDLPGFIFDECRRLGVDENHIINDGRDTYKESEIFYSHRRAVVTEDVNEDQRFVVSAWLV